MAMTYEMELGWVAERMGLKSGHWKRKARVGLDKGKEKETSPIQRKRVGLTPLVVLDQNMQEAKRKKGVSQVSEDVEKENTKDGDVAVVARQHH
nr:hypothetical protein CFP56_72818 [Quercus suber]